MNPYILYLVVAFGTFMSYIYSPTFDDAEARLVFHRLFFGRKRQRALEFFLLLLNVFAGAGLAYLILEPTTTKLAVTAGLGWTSIASIVRTTAGGLVAGGAPQRTQNQQREQ
jgi:uncharacterized membrane protein YbjE (DUF340 family)